MEQIVERMKKFVYKYRYILIGLSVFIVIYIMCASSMYAQDEYNYSNISWTSQRITGIKDLIFSLRRIYFNWSGRLIALGLSQVFLFIGKGYYDILNSIVFVFFIYMLCKVTGKKVSALCLICSLFLVSIGISEFWQKCIWLTASFNYLWTAFFMLITMYYFYNIIINDKKLTKLEKFFFYVFSFCAGLSHENTAFVMGSFIIVLGLANFKKFLKMNFKEKMNIIIPIILFGIGAMILIFSPGNFNRLGESDISIKLSLILSNFYYIRVMLVIFVLTTIAIFCRKDSRDVVKKNFLYFILPMFIALLPMTIIHDFPARAMLAYESCIMICILNNVRELENLLDKKKKIKTALCVIILIIAFTPLILKAWFASKYVAPYREKMIDELTIAKAEGIEDAVIEGFDKTEEASKLGLYMDMFAEVSDLSVINSYMSTYYGFKSITAVPKDCMIIEIDIKDEEVVEVYNLVRRDTGEFYSARITSAVAPMPDLTYKNRIVFCIPKSEYEAVRLELPNEVLENVISSKLIEYGNVREFDINELLD